MGRDIRRGDLEVWCRANWDSLPAAKRQQLLDHIRPKFLPEDLATMRVQHARGERICHHLPGFHFGTGMAIRNVLRDIMKDDELPPVSYRGAPIPAEGNWDDYYTGALEELCEEEPPPPRRTGRLAWIWGWWR